MKTNVSNSQDLRRYYLSEFSLYDGDHFITFNIVDINTVRQVSLYDKDFISRYNEMNNDADLTIVFGGTNDFGHGDAPLGILGDKTEYTFYGACSKLLEKLIKKYGKSKILIITPLHRKGEDNLRGEGKKFTDGNPLKDYVKAIKEVALYYDLKIIDLYEDNDLNPNILEKDKKYFHDGLHPNDAGHALLAKKLKDFLENNF